MVFLSQITMKNLFKLLFIFVIQITFSQKSLTDYVITNVSIIPMNSEIILKNKDVLIRNGKISAISDYKKVSYKPITIINGTGKFIVPSLSDAHVHLPENEVELEKCLKLNLINGVTKIRSMRGDDKQIEWRKKYSEPRSMYPKMYLSSVAINKKDDFTPESMAKFVNETKTKGYNFIKMLSIKDKSIFEALDKSCKEYNFKIAGHFPDNVDDETIFKSNLNSIEHLGGFMYAEEMQQKSRKENILKNNIFNCPTFDWYAVMEDQFSLEELKKRKGLQFVEKSKLTEWENNYKTEHSKIPENQKETYKKQLSEDISTRYSTLKKLSDSGINLLIGPDSSADYSVYGFGVLEEMNHFKKAGISNYKILKAATSNFADYFDDKTYGTIEVGKNADFLILDQNPLENLSALEKIEGIFYNSNYLDAKKLQIISSQIMPIH